MRLVAVALGGRDGARLSEHQVAGVGKDALLVLVRAVPDPEAGLAPPASCTEQRLGEAQPRQGRHGGM